MVDYKGDIFESRYWLGQVSYIKELSFSWAQDDLY